LENQRNFLLAPQVVIGTGALGAEIHGKWSIFSAI
jgi:hypothetical protein